MKKLLLIYALLLACTVNSENRSVVMSKCAHTNTVYAEVSVVQHFPGHDADYIAPQKTPGKNNRRPRVSAGETEILIIK